MTKGQEPSCCDEEVDAMEILTPYPPPLTKLQKVERWLDRYNHIMELCRTLLALVMFGMQFVILAHLFN